MKIKDVVYQFRHYLSDLNELSDDRLISNRLIAFHLCGVKALLIYKDKKLNDQLKSEICCDLEPINEFCGIKGCTVMCSDKILPKTLDNKYYVFDLAGNEYSQVEFDKLSRQKVSKYKKKYIYSIRDTGEGNKIYVYSKSLTKIIVSGVFEDQLEAIDECEDLLEKEFKIEKRLLPELFQLAFQQLTNTRHLDDTTDNEKQNNQRLPSQFSQTNNRK